MAETKLKDQSLETKYGAFITATGNLSFPATQASSAGANVLDDYEEGSWTPTGNNVTFSVAYGFYNKIGSLVVASFQVTFPSTADTNTAQIKSLPFTSLAAADSWQGGFITYTSFASWVSLLCSGNSTAASFYTFGGASKTNANLTGASFRGVIIYRASA